MDILYRDMDGGDGHVPSSLLVCLSSCICVRIMAMLEIIVIIAFHWLYVVLLAQFLSLPTISLVPWHLLEEQEPLLHSLFYVFSILHFGYSLCVLYGKTKKIERTCISIWSTCYPSFRYPSFHRWSSLLGLSLQSLLLYSRISYYLPENTNYG